ncbi:MAG: amidohydrolase family protein, partial [Candidatus Kariarchaeaceae archaeon]
SVPEDTFTEIYHAADERDTWIHTHVSETTTERANALKTWGMSTVKKFNEMGVLDRILPAHGVHMDDEDLQLIADHGLPILHNLGSNLKIGSGIAPVPKMLDLGIPVVLGTDGNASNNDLAVLEEIRLAALIHKGIHQDPTLLPTRTVINMATSNHQTIFGEVYTGTLQQGHPADIAVFNLDTVRSRPVIDPLSNLVYSISPTDCQLTISNGKILYQDGELTSIDLEPLLKKAQSVSERMIADADYKRY